MKFIIFHGAFGNANGNRFPYLKTELQKLKQDVIIEQFPIENWDEVIKTGISYIPKKQSLSNWLKIFEKKVLPKISKNDKLCFIGHSLGPVFILHLLEKYNIKLDCAIFVMPFMQSLKNKSTWMFDLVNKTFYKSNFNFKALQNNITISYVVYSNNDIVPSNMCLDFAKKLNSNIILLKNAKHINAPQFTKLPLVLELCKSRLDPKVYLK